MIIITFYTQFQSSMGSVEDKLVSAEGEISQLRSNLRQYETLVDEYRGQVKRFLLALMVNQWA